MVAKPLDGGDTAVEQRPLSSNTDKLKPLRTYATRQETARRDFNIQVRGSESGWITETLVTPFWYDTEI